MKRVILFLFLVVPFIPLSSFAEEYTLEDLYRIALEKSETVRIAEGDTYIAEREKDRAHAALLPTLSAFGSHTEYSDGQQAAVSTPIAIDRSTSYGVSLDQSLSLSGRELTALKIAKQNIVISRFDLDGVREAYLLGVASAYYDVLKARKSLEIANANVERLTKHRDAAKTRLRVGEITKTVLLRAEAELSGAQSDLIQSDNSLKLAKTVLARTAGITGEYDIRETDVGAIHELPLQDCSHRDLECLKRTAMAERYELQSAGLQKEVAENQVRFSKGTYWPSLSVRGEYARRDDHPSSAFTDKDSTSGTLRLDFPFFEGGLRRAEVRQAEARLGQAEYRLADLQKSVNVEVESAYLLLMTQAGIIEKLQAQVTFAADNYNAVSKQFEYGLANSLDVMDANNLLVTSERQLANSRYDYQLAILQIKRSTGTLLKTVVSSQ